MALETKKDGPWFKGVAYNLPIEDIPPDMLSSMENCRIGQAGQVEKRAGFDGYKNIGAIAGAPTFTGCGELHISDPTTTTTVFATAGTKFYEATTSPDAWTDRTASITITAGDDNVFQFANANGILYGTNGADVPIKWTGAGNNITNMTVPSGLTKANHIAFWDNRLWLASPTISGTYYADRMYRSGIADYENLADFHNFGRPVRAVVPMQDALAIHTDAGIWTMTPTGNADVPYQTTQVTNLAGISGRAVITLPGEQQIFVRRDGIYKWASGQDVEKISHQLDGYWTDVIRNRLEYSFAVQYPLENEVWFFLPNGIGQTAMNQVIVYNWREDGSYEGFWYGPYTGFTRYSAALINDKPHAGGTTGLLYDHVEGDSDDGAAISAYFQTGGQPPVDEATRVRWMYARLAFDFMGNYAVNFTQLAGHLEGSARSLIVGGKDAGVLDTMVLDVDSISHRPSGKPDILFRDVDLQGYSPNSSIRITVNSADQPFTFRHVHQQYKTIGIKRRRKTGVE
tara:strand:- start:1118 stop:2656 length:1539 start_codon:yes stop_codon:yes gene_type:complete